MTRRRAPTVTNLSRNGTSKVVAESFLFAGMSARAEIVTGRRTVLDYVLSPISRAVQEAGMER